MEVVRLCHQSKTIGKAVRLTHHKERIKGAVLQKKLIPVSLKIRERKDYGESSPCLSCEKEWNNKSICIIKNRLTPILIFFLVFFYFSHTYPLWLLWCNLSNRFSKIFLPFGWHSLFLCLRERESWVGQKFEPSQNWILLTCYKAKML